MSILTNTHCVFSMLIRHSLRGMACALALLAALPAMAVSPNIVISQVYGGGGNAGAPYTNDFIELFNRSAAPVSVAGWSVQYASSAGNFALTQKVDITGVIPAGGYYLVQMGNAGGVVAGVALPAVNATGTTNMSGTAGKVALVNSTTVLTTTGCPIGASVVDFVGYGAAANCFEGATAPAPSNTTSILRGVNGCTDTDANNANFATGAPNPRNSGTAVNVCTNLAISSVTANEGNAGTTNFDFIVTLSAAQVTATTFDIATVAGSATAGSDYVSNSITGATIAAGATTFTFTVVVNGDTLPEGDETFSVAISNVSPAAILAGSAGIGTITNDDAAPNLTIAPVTLSEGNAGTTAFAFTVSLSTTSATPITFDIATADGTALAGSDYVANTLTGQSIAPGSTTYTFTVNVNGDTVGEPNETFAVNITNIVGAIGVTTTATGTITNDDVFRIHTVQGSGTASPLAGQLVTIEGIVTADYQGANQLKGFYIQEPDALVDGNPLTSEGMFVFTNLAPFAVAPGDLVRVVGTVVEFGTVPNTLTEIVTPTITTLSTGNALPAPIVVSLPVAVTGDLERYEGMRVQFTQSLTVSDHFDLAHFGEVTLSANGRAFNPTNVVDPNDNPATGTANATNNSANVAAFADTNTRSRILLDDASTVPYPASIPFTDPATGSLRLGSTVSNLTGIMSQAFGSHRVYATTAPVFAYAPRPLTPPFVGGNLKVGAMNVLNYFNGDGLGGGFPTARGANTLAEFNRQRPKILAALLGLDADIVTLMEIENDGTGTNSAVQDLVNGLNASAGAGVWAFVGDPAGWGTINGSTDQIKATIIYKTTKVTPVGLPTSPNDIAFVIGRAPVAQTFQMNSNGEQLTVIANHFKSKSSSGATGLDVDSGQGAYNNTRTLQATALVNFIATFPGAPRVIALGDYNAYEQEDPMDTLRAGGLGTLINNTYSYMFDGLSGSLDHAVGNAALTATVTGADKWHINADEPVYLDYNVETKNNPGCTPTIAVPCTTPDLVSAIPFRASDHDPVLVGLQLNGVQCLAGNFSATGFAPCTAASAGSFVAANGATAQVACAVGSFSAAAGATVCTLAAAGSFVAGVGATAEALCAAGSFSATAGATSCTLAGLGFFVPLAGASAQTACAVGTTTLAAGATVCVPITFSVTPSAGANGTISPNTAVAVASGQTTQFSVSPNAGFSASVATGAGECGGSLVGTTYTTAAITAACNVTASFVAIPVQCIAGTFSATGNAPCTAAPAGSFVSTAGATSATLCAIGSFSASTGATACTLASAGSFVAGTGATAQTPASAGSFVAAAGAGTQSLCAPGSFSATTGAVSCTQAAIGFFVSATGATAQTACAAGTTTLAIGATLCVPITFTITPSAGANGAISPNTAQTVASGQTTTFTITANAGFSAAITAGAGNCGGALVGTTYTTAAITASCNVAVTFVALNTFNLVIEGAQEVPANASTGGGSGAAIVDTVNNTITLNFSYAGVGPLTAAHLHGPGARAVGAGVKQGLSNLISPVTEVLVYSETDEADILAGNWYLNLHTGAFPGGEIRAQLDNLGAANKTLTVVLAGAGSGSVTGTGINCGVDCTELYAHNTITTLTATPVAGGSFAGWSGAGCTGTGTCAVTMDFLKTVTATFTLNPVQCAAGNFSATGNAPCTPAPAGSFVATTGATSATLCAVGSFSSAAGASVCTPASAGSFVAVAGATAQTLCAAGSFSAASSSAACTPAALGFFVAATGATSQTACAAGTTTLVTGATVCVPITFTVTPSAGANGAISPNTAQTVALGLTTTFTITANAGFNTVITTGAGNCGGALVGTTFTTAVITAACNVSATFTATPVQCVAGTFSATGNAPCTPAPAGSFVTGLGATSSTLCAIGSFSSAAGASVCTPASAGSFVAAAGATAQTLCAAGSFSAASSSAACTPAALGFFVAAAGATSQTACAVGTTTLATGATVCVPITFTVTPSAGANGAISPNTAQTVALGLTTTFTITPNAGFNTVITTGAGNCGGALVGTTFTTAAITSACNVAATFTAIPVQCVAGTFSATGNAPCTSAPAGSFVTGLGATSATLCAIGSFSSAAGASACTVASAGSFVPTTGATAQTPASAGSFVAAAGAGAQTQCVAGRFSATTGATTCTLAALGFFVPTAGATAQTACAAGTTTLTTGALVCVPVTFTVTPSATATGVITPNTPQQVPVGTAATFQVFTLTANATFVPIIASGPGNCGGTLTGSTYVTAPITANCNVAVSFGPPPPSPASFTTDNPVARFGEIVTLTLRVDGGGTTTFSTDEGNPIPGCLNVPVINGTASCLVPSRYGVLNPLRFIGNYSGDSRNPPFSSVLAPLVQYDNAVLSTSSDAVNPVRAGSQVTVTALVRMRSPVGTVTFYPDNYAPDPLLPLSDTNPRPIAGCEAKPLTMLPSATDSAIVKCTITAPASGSTRVVAYYRYPAGHVSSRAFELEFQPITTIANPPANYTDMWWGGIAQNGWGVSITQHGAIQFNVIYAYDSAGKPTWYVMPGCTWNAANTICTGALYSPTGTPFAQYDATRFVPGAAIGTVSFTYKTAATATMAYTINGVSGSKEIERQVFSTATTEPNLAVNDIWWNGLAENGWGINIAQQGRQLFPVWYTYDTAGKPTFYAVSGGTWNGLVFTGNIYTTTSSPWLGVPYDASKFVVTKVGTMVIDYRDANTATITYNIGDVTQTKLIVRQPY